MQLALDMQSDGVVGNYDVTSSYNLRKISTKDDSLHLPLGTPSHQHLEVRLRLRELLE